MRFYLLADVPREFSVPVPPWRRMARFQAASSSRETVRKADSRMPVKTAQIQFGPVTLATQPSLAVIAMPTSPAEPIRNSIFTTPPASRNRKRLTKLYASRPNAILGSTTRILRAGELKSRASPPS